MALATPSAAAELDAAPRPNDRTLPEPAGPHLRIAQREHREDDHVRIEIFVERIDESGGETPIFTYVFDFEGTVLPPPQTTANMGLIAALFMAMEQGLPVRVAGAVSRLLLANLEEFQDAWSTWCPNLYRRVPLFADRLVDSVDRSGGEGQGVMLYSGGVDANFTLINQLFGDQPHRRREIVAALLVHGYDVPLDRGDIFEERRQRAAGILASYGIPLVTVRSNWRAPNKHYRDYGNGHAAALAACLHAYENLVEVGIIASDRNYSYMSLEPNGSNPITNSYLSSSQLRFATDGTRFTRTAKVAALSAHPTLRDQLQVCQTEYASNCCVCEKCIRTMLCFDAVGAERGRAFPRRPELWRLLLNFYWISAKAIPYYQDVIAVSRQKGTMGWVRSLLRVVVALAWLKTSAGAVARRVGLHR